MPISWQSFVLHLINIVVLYVFLRSFLYKPVSEFMRKRTERFATEKKDLQNRKELLSQQEQQAEQTIEEARKKALEILEDAEKAAQQRTEQILKDAEEKAKALIAEAEVAILEEKRREKEQMRTEAINLAVELAAKILTKELTPVYNKEFINRMTESRQIHG
ncbi:MAG: F0F1 ATP synthase subunit B [Firmicutes bacterium]|nr:F0F1 ATP synthase subunit B [Bacillota bacterium]